MLSSPFLDTWIASLGGAPPTDSPAFRTKGTVFSMPKPQGGRVWKPIFAEEPDRSTERWETAVWVDPEMSIWGARQESGSTAAFMEHDSLLKGN